VAGQGQLNINTASALVLSAPGLSAAEILEIQATRREVPNTTVPPRFSTRRLIAATRTYRIEATGIIDGSPRARLTAVVEVGDDANQSLRILSWSGIR
jgi:hypothetical protein